MFKFVIKIPNQRKPTLGVDDSIFEEGGGGQLASFGDRKIAQGQVVGQSVFQFAPYISLVDSFLCDLFFVALSCARISFW